MLWILCELEWIRMVSWRTDTCLLEVATGSCHLASVVQASLGKGLQVIFDTNPSTRCYEKSQFGSCSTSSFSSSKNIYYILKGKVALMKFQILRADLKRFVCLSRENSYFRHFEKITC